MPLTAAFSKGKTKRHPYYLCQNNDCVSRGKSLRRADVEGAFEEVLRNVIPKKNTIDIGKDMLSKIWAHREAYQKQLAKEAKNKILELDQKASKLIDIILETDSDIMHKKFQSKLNKLEEEKAILHEKAT